MLRVFGNRGSGKTTRLIKEAIDNDAIFITPVNKEEVKKLALSKYGTDSIEVLTPQQFVDQFVMRRKFFPKDTKIVIDELDLFLELISHVQVIGYTDNLDKMEMLYGEDCNK